MEEVLAFTLGVAAGGDQRTTDLPIMIQEDGQPGIPQTERADNHDPYPVFAQKTKLQVRDVNHTA